MKKIGTAIYTHTSNMKNFTKKMNEMFGNASEIMWQQNMMWEWLQGVVIKFDIKKNTVSFIESPDWNTAREPQVGNAYRVDIDLKEIKTIKSKGQIYHHKWMFVADDYDGFDIEESKRWSEQWQKVLPNDRKIKSRIGYKKYWEEYLEEFGLK